MSGQARVHSEALEQRQLLAGQVFAGEGPVVTSTPRAVVAADVNLDGRIDLVTAHGTSATLLIALGNGDGTFAAATPFEGVANATSLIAADFNHDGRTDLAVSGGGTTGTVAVFRNTTTNGNISWSKHSFSVYSTINAIAAADLDQDDHPDLAIATALNNGSGLFVMRNTGADDYVAFYTPMHLGVNYAVPSIAAADFDNDGRIDLAAAGGTSAPITLLRNTGVNPGSPLLAPVGTIALYATNLAAADVNGDGRADLASTNGGLGLFTLHLAADAPGTIAFAASQTTAGGSPAGPIVAADFNTDGRPDFAVLNAYNNFDSDSVRIITTQLNDDSVGFSSASFVTGPTPVAAAAADFNGDGKTDLAVANVTNSQGPSYVSVLTNATTNPFDVVLTAGNLTTSAGNTPQATVSADFDGDGKTDVAVANFSGNNVCVLRNTTPADGETAFAPSSLFPVASSPRFMKAADFDGDGKTDLLTFRSGTFTVLRNTSTPGIISFAADVRFGLTGGSDVAIGDFNGDGKTDVAVIASGPTSHLSVYVNAGLPGTIAFATPVMSTMSSSFVAITSGDFNGDGKTDLAVAGSQRVIALYNITTDATPIAFSPTLFYTAFSASRIDAADFDSDGRLDLVLLSSWAGNSQLTVWRNNGSSGSRPFDGRETYDAGDYASGMAVGDFDSDGRPDVAVAADGVRLFRNTTTQTGFPYFFNRTAVATGRDTRGVSVGDSNADGRADLAVTNGTENTVTFLTNRLPADPYADLNRGVLTLHGNVTVSAADGFFNVLTPAGTRTFAVAAVSGVMINGNAIVNADLGANRPIELRVNANATAALGVSQHVGNVVLDGQAVFGLNGGLVLRTGGLSFGKTGRLDLNDNALLYDYAADAGQLGVVRSLIGGGRSGGSWTGPGLTSSAVRNRPGGGTTLGLMTAADYRSIYGTAALFAGEAIDDTAVLVKYTLAGDANFDATVDFNDFLRLQNGFGTTSGATFAGGDFDFDGDADFNDFLSLQNNFGTALTADASATQ